MPQDLPPTETIIRGLLCDGVAPAIVAALVLLLFAVWRRPGLGIVGAVLAVAAGWAAGNYMSAAPAAIGEWWGKWTGDPMMPWVPEKLPKSLSWLPDEQSWYLLPAVAAGLMLVALLTRIPQLPLALRWLLCAAASAAAAWLLVPSEVGAAQEKVELTSAAILIRQLGLVAKDAPIPADLLMKMKWAAWIAFGVVVFVNWLLLDHLAKKRPGGMIALGLALVLLAAAAVVLQAGWGSTAEIALMLVASFLGVALVAWCFRVDVGGTVPSAVVWLPGLMLASLSNTDSAVPLTVFLIIPLAPLALAVVVAGFQALFAPPA